MAFSSGGLRSEPPHAGSSRELVSNLRDATVPVRLFTYRQEPRYLALDRHKHTVALAVVPESTLAWSGNDLSTHSSVPARTNGFDKALSVK